jgi:hypothetical protein
MDELMPLKNTNSLTLDGFADEDAFLKFVRDARQDDLNTDERNRDRGIDDTRYAAGYQWPIDDYRWRVDNKIPAMTFNMVPSLLRHRLGARARKRIGPKIQPTTPGQMYDGIAQIREGLIRNIELNSDIKVVDAVVSQNQLVSGVANYEVSIEYANNDVFETDIVIRSDANPWSVIWDGQSTEPTGRDARRVIKETVVTRADFQKMFPKAEAVDIGTNPGATVINNGQVTTDGKGGAFSEWVNQDTIRIAIVWIMRERTKNIAMLTNGDVVDIGDTPPEAYSVPDGNGGFHTVVQEADGEYKWRQSPVKYAKGYLTNGVEILAEPYEMPIDRVPIVRVPGWMIYTGDRMERYGMITFAKDALTFYNYVKSDRIERIVYRNRAQYEAQEDSLSAEQLKGYQNAHKFRGGVLKYRGPKPEQVQAPVVDQAAIIETQAAQESIYDIFDIRPGLAGSQGQTAPSGISLERQLDITDTGGMIYDDMQIAAKREVYRICDQLIPYNYDAKRVVKIVGQDGNIKEAILNDPENPESIDVTLGKYVVDVTTGPSFDTQRVQAISMIETAMNANPEIIPIALPESLKLMNVPGMEGLIQSLEKLGGTGEVSPEEEQRAADMEQREQDLQERMIELEMQQKEFQNQKLQAETEAKLAEAQAKLMQAETARAQAEEQVRAARANETERFAKMDEMAERVALIAAQTEKVYAEIERIKATPIPQPEPKQSLFGGKKK